MPTTLQLKVTINDTKPPIFRRLIVSNDTSFFELHHIIQIAMGWQNFHLFEFRFNDYVIGIPTEAFEEEASGQETVIDADTITLGEVLSDVNDTMIYTYDFGDNWEHEITVEKINADATDYIAPICIEGNLSCPPEDCGGAPGFEHLFKVIKDNQHPDHEQMLNWLDENYTQEGFDIDDVNATLASLEDYINNWLNNMDEEEDEDDN
jgi:Plasmid pRiA4b ORF-3-like protein